RAWRSRHVLDVHPPGWAGDSGALACHSTTRRRSHDPRAAHRHTGGTGRCAIPRALAGPRSDDSNLARRVCAVVLGRTFASLFAGIPAADLSTGWIWDASSPGAAGADGRAHRSSVVRTHAAFEHARRARHGL